MKQHFKQHLTSPSLLAKLTVLPERRRRRRDTLDGERSSGTALFFDVSSVVEAGKAVVVSSAKLVLRLEGRGRVAVLQRLEGGGRVTLGTRLLVEGETEVEVEVGHAVQGWLLEAESNLGLEVQGEVVVGAVELLLNSQVSAEEIGQY